jgi:hypothetical protein
MPKTTPFDPLSGPASAAEDGFQVRVGRGATGRATSGALGGRLTKLLAGKKIGGGSRGAGIAGARAFVGGFGSDARQRVIAKVSFRNHFTRGGGGGAGGGKLLAHASYLERHGAAREGEKGQFYDSQRDIAADVPERLREWSAEDKRHFRIMLAPESGARFAGDLGELKDFTREVMARIERDLGVKTDWIAVDHYNTDNPHTHVILRGVRRDGADLVLPREYVAHGLREAARDVATELIGERGIADERLRLERETQARGLTRLDQAIERQLGEKREILLQELGRGDNPAFANALRARARELERLGLAQETRRNVMTFAPDWTERLAAGKPLDLRRELARARLYEPRMGRVAGEVRELGPRGEHPDRAALVIDTPDRGRLLVNTSMEAIADLQKGSLVALEPDGKRAAIERLAFHPVQEQVHARADTALDRELDRIARGRARVLPPLDGVERALADRAAWHAEAGHGALSASGKFYFRDGAREALREAESKEIGAALQRDTGRDVQDIAASPQDSWKVRGVRELFAGKTAILERGLGVAMAPIARGAEIAIGNHVELKMSQGRELGLAPSLEIVRGLEKGITLGLGR